MNDPSRAAILDTLLKEAGIPIEGISVNNVNPGPPEVTVQYRPEVTQQQRDLAESIVDDFDWREREPLDRNTVVSSLGGLSSGDSVLIHKGGVDNTWSAACQTIPKTVFGDFWSNLGKQSEFEYVLVKVA